MEKLDDELPYLKLREGEKFLFVKQFEEGGIPIKGLAKGYDPEPFPEHLIKITDDWVKYDRYDIITNFRLIKFAINDNYMEEDGVTPISEIFHHEHAFIWVNLEDIIDYKVDIRLGSYGSGVMGFKFFGKGRLKVKEHPLDFTGYNYEEYCQVKDIVVKLLKFEQQEVAEEEDKKIQKIIKKNKNIVYWMFIGLIIFGGYIILPIFPSDTQNSAKRFMQVSLIGLYVVYMVFFLLLNFITYRILLKKYKKKRFFTLMKVDFAWYIGPGISAVVIILVFGILLMELGLLSIIGNEWLAFLISVGFWTIAVILIVMFDLNSRKKKKAKKATDMEV